MAFCYTEFPGFWVANISKIKNYISSIEKSVEVHEIGKSAGGRQIQVIELGNKNVDINLLIIGGTHGHEPAPVATIINLIHIILTGKDLKGEEWLFIRNYISNIHLWIVPVLNPDGRCRCPDSFVHYPSSTIRVFERGVDKEGKILCGDLPLKIDPSEMIFIGGRYNDKGIRLNRHIPLKIESCEANLILNFFDNIKPGFVVDLHACRHNFIIHNLQFRDGFTNHLKGINQYIKNEFSKRKFVWKDMVFRKNEFNTICELFYKKYGSLAFILEGSQGYLDEVPQLDYKDIIDQYLLSISAILKYASMNGNVIDSGSKTVPKKPVWGRIKRKIKKVYG